MEYEALINAADFISILKLKARHQLGSKFNSKWMWQRGNLCAAGLPNVANIAVCARKIANWRATVQVPAMNDARRVEIRQEILKFRDLA
jgi:hypothetical protein